ncbi:MAG TPA: outer membrane protein assembly factor BamA [Planctomycetota bacterium]|nr:outer membrane protein assembly factor BamA [Planctomycetota bacterium]
MRTVVVAASSRTNGGRGVSALLVLVFALGVAVGLARAQDRPVPSVRDIGVEGNRRIQSPAILNRVQTKIGDPFAPSALREDVRAIFALGFFDDVQVRTEEFEGGVRLIFVVVERPILREVSFEGNQEIKTDDLREKAAIRIGGLYNPVEAQRAEEAMRKKYEDEGFFGVVISPRTERTPEGDLRLVFRVEEGRKIYIDRLVIEGNQALSTRQIKGAMQTQERFLWILPFASVQRKVFDEDVDRIVNLYADHGYVQARVDMHEIVPDLQRGKVTLRIRVVEGPQFRVGTTTIRGNEALSEAEIRRLIRLREGDVFSRGILRASVRAIADRYSEVGRSRAEIAPETESDPVNLRVNVSFSITEGGEVYVERINITGNARSSEKVLRRELRVVEGELFSFQGLVRSRQRLFNLGYFDEVNVSTEPGSTPDKVVVNIDVRERATGLFSIGAGYSSVDGVFGTVEVTQRNLFGRGQEAFLRVRIGANSQLGLIGFTEPYLFDMPLRAGVDFYDRETDFSDFSDSRLGGDLRASYPLGEYTTIGGTYRLEDVKVTNISESASDDLKREAGRKLNSVVEFALVRDTRDNIFEPSSGSRNVIDVSFAGLGGDVQYYKLIAESAWYFPLPVFDLVFAVRGMAGIARGWGGQEVPIFSRFFLGGSSTLRGQRTRSVGPTDATGAVIGGDSQLLFNAELIIPIFPRFRVAFFLDAGNAYGFGTPFDPTNLRLGAGPGLRFFSPLGPIRLDYGFNLDRKPGEKTGYVQFTVGSPF